GLTSSYVPLPAPQPYRSKMHSYNLRAGKLPVKRLKDLMLRAFQSLSAKILTLQFSERLENGLPQLSPFFHKLLRIIRMNHNIKLNAPFHELSPEPPKIHPISPKL